ncbi:hypothetical protein GCM10027047_18880 [Rhodococcus aerolatus]
MADPARARKLSKRIGQIVASALEFEVKDPRLDFVTVTDVRVTNDLHDATVYYTVLGRTVEEEPDLQGAALALEKARGQLRTRVGAGTGVRFTPTLTFVADTVPDTARHMEELLARARAADDEVARAAAGATPAGDADPYRDTSPRSTDPEDTVPDDDPAATDDSTPAAADAAGDTRDGDTTEDPTSGAEALRGDVDPDDALDRGPAGGAHSQR